MKFKLLTVCIVMFTFWGVPMGASTWAASFGPENYAAKITYGEGVYYAPYHIRIYREPKEDAPIIQEFTWSHHANNLTLFSPLKNEMIQANQVCLAFYPDLDAALMAVTGENGAGWAEVVYDQPLQKTGWVHLGDINADSPEKTAPPQLGKFQTWYDFMRLNAKSHGVYWLSGISEYQRGVRSTPEDTAKLIQLTFIRGMQVKFVRGNWMLVEVIDFDRSAPIGWIRWRDDTGKLLLFPNFAGETQSFIQHF